MHAIPKKMNRLLLLLSILVLGIASCNQRYFYLAKVSVNHAKPEPVYKQSYAAIPLKPHVPALMSVKPTMKQAPSPIHRRIQIHKSKNEKAGNKPEMLSETKPNQQAHQHKAAPKYVLAIGLLWALAVFFFLGFAFSVVYVPLAIVLLPLAIIMVVWAIVLGSKRRKLRLSEKAGAGTDASAVKFNGPQLIGRILLWILAFDLIFLTFPLMSSGYALYGVLSLLAGIYMIYLLRKHNKGYYRIEK